MRVPWGAVRQVHTAAAWRFCWKTDLPQDEIPKKSNFVSSAVHRDKSWKYSMKAVKVWHVLLAGRKENKNDHRTVCLSTSISSGSYSYGISQPWLYVPLGHFFQERPSHNRRVRRSHYRRVRKSHNPVTHDDKGRAGNWAGSIKLKSNTFQDKIKTEYNNFFGGLSWQMHWGYRTFYCCGFFFFLFFFFSLCMFFSHMQDCCLFVETIPRKVNPENTWLMVIYDSALQICTPNQLKEKI